MNIRDLKYLVAVADHGHFGRAAEKCFVSQPALSMQIMKLEESLGVTLLERTSKAIMLTEHGETIVERARQILSQIEEVREIAKSAADPLSGELRVGIFPTLAPYVLPLMMPAITAAYPKLTIYLIEEQSPRLIEQLREGKLHAAFLASPVSEKSFHHHLLFEEEFLLAAPMSDTLAALKAVKQQDLKGRNLLLLDEGHCLRDHALDVCHMIQAKESQTFRATSLETLRHMVAAGVGITLMPKLACYPSDTIAYLPFADPKPVRSVGLYWRNSTAKHILLEKMAATIKSILQKQKTLKIME